MKKIIDNPALSSFSRFIGFDSLDKTYSHLDFLNKLYISYKTKWSENIMEFLEMLMLVISIIAGLLSIAASILFLKMNYQKFKQQKEF